MRRFMRKATGVVLASFVVFAVSGCTVARQTWIKSGGSDAEAAKDLQGCAHQEGFIFDPKGEKGGPVAISSKSTYKASKFDSCMIGKGFRKK